MLFPKLNAWNNPRLVEMPLDKSITQNKIHFSVCVVMVTVKENKDGELCSKPGWGYLYFTSC